MDVSGAQNVMSKVNISLMRMALDQVELQGEQLAKMMETTQVPPLDGTGGLLNLVI